MKNAQTKTIQRLVDIKTRNAEVAEQAYATASAVVVHAEKARDEAQQKYFDVMDGKDGSPEIATAADLEDRDRHLRALRRYVDVAEAKVTKCREQETQARNMMTEARMEKRRFETWLERETTALKAEAHRVERIAEDEVATRKKALA